jgi:hypothetical protein
MKRSAVVFKHIDFVLKRSSWRLVRLNMQNDCDSKFDIGYGICILSMH